MTFVRHPREGGDPSPTGAVLRAGREMGPRLRGGDGKGSRGGA